jgi:DNA-directed RNA polymerase specialized sigma subunit
MESTVIQDFTIKDAEYFKDETIPNCNEHSWDPSVMEEMFTTEDSLWYESEDALTHRMRFAEKLEDINLWEFAKESLTVKQFNVLEQRCRYLHTSAEVGKILGIAPQTVTLSLKASGKKIRKKLRQLYPEFFNEFVQFI